MGGIQCLSSFWHNRQNNLHSPPHHHALFKCSSDSPHSWFGGQRVLLCMWKSLHRGLPLTRLISWLLPIMSSQKYMSTTSTMNQSRRIAPYHSLSMLSSTILHQRKRERGNFQPFPFLLAITPPQKNTQIPSRSQHSGADGGWGAAGGEAVKVSALLAPLLEPLLDQNAFCQLRDTVRYNPLLAERDHSRENTGLSARTTE